mmetsp:Transcript_16088/g.24964  ORF Transcript_16088/g.24964 Transcript_16088/m.24964 type:complete len:419 (+) Transcript_16088:195-1451(+)
MRTNMLFAPLLLGIAVSEVAGFSVPVLLGSSTSQSLTSSTCGAKDHGSFAASSSALQALKLGQASFATGVSQKPASRSRMESSTTLRMAASSPQLTILADEATEKMLSMSKSDKLSAVKTAVEFDCKVAGWMAEMRVMSAKAPGQTEDLQPKLETLSRAVKTVLDSSRAEAIQGMDRMITDIPQNLELDILQVITEGAAQKMKLLSSQQKAVELTAATELDKKVNDWLQISRTLTGSKAQDLQKQTEQLAKASKSVIAASGAGALLGALDALEVYGSKTLQKQDNQVVTKVESQNGASVPVTSKPAAPAAQAPDSVQLKKLEAMAFHAAQQIATLKGDERAQALEKAKAFEEKLQAWVKLTAESADQAEKMVAIAKQREVELESVRQPLKAFFDEVEVPPKPEEKKGFFGKLGQMFKS